MTPLLLALDLVLMPPEVRLAGLPPLYAGRLMLAEEQYRIGYDLAIQQRLGAVAAVAACNLGAVAYERGDLDSAEVWFRHALDIDPRHDEALANLGSVLFRQAQQSQDRALAEQALGFYEQALQEAPNRVETLRNAANVLEALGRTEQARLGYARAKWLEDGRGRQ